MKEQLLKLIKIRHKTFIAFLELYWFLCTLGQSSKIKLIRPISYEETKVPPYKLPDLLLCEDGTKVRSIKQWEEKRRPELLYLFSEYMYGKTPCVNEDIKWIVLRTQENALGGKAIRRDVRVYPLANHLEHSINVQMYLPSYSKEKPVPLFFAMALLPNYTVCNDPEVDMPDFILAENGKRKKAVKRGCMSEFWQLDKLLERGYGLVTFCHQDLSPDTLNDFLKGVPSLYYIPGMKCPYPNEWGSISFWAWQMSRVMDYLVTDKLVDNKRIIAIGHSRFGKTALWAAAQDKRFAIVISNNSGCGGAAISRRCFGETIEAINRKFPQWFCGNFKQFDNRENYLPFDQHELIALIAPRPVYIASAEEDRWADPKGEFLGGKEATPIYNLYGLDGLECKEIPDIECPQSKGYVGFHIRKGGHTMTQYDWIQYLNFVDRHFDKINKI